MVENAKKEEKIVLTKEEIEQARKIIKSVISTKEKVGMYGLAGVAAVTDVVGKVIPQFASLGYRYLGGKLGAEYINANTQNLFFGVAQYIYDKVSYKMVEKLLRDWDTRPGMEQKMHNSYVEANNIYEMAYRSGQYMVQNAKKVLGITNATFGGFLTVGSLSIAAPVLPVSVFTTAASILGGSAVIGYGQYWFLRKFKNKNVDNREDVIENRNKLVAYVQQMLINSQMRAKTLSDEQSFNKLYKKTADTLKPSRKFLKTLAGYFAGIKSIEFLGAAVVFYGAYKAGMSVPVAAALTSGVSTTIASLNNVSSAFLEVDGLKESFARRFKRYKEGIKNFEWGNENVNTNANVLQINNIQYRFRNKDDKSPVYGEYGDKTVFTTNEDIRFGPGISLLSGASGAGKSTLISLLNHEDYVTSGAICIGTTNENGNFIGQDYRDLKHKEINKNIAFAEANPQLEMGTVDEYIRLGNPNADEKKVEEIKKMLEIVSEEPEIGKDGMPTGKMKPRQLDANSSDSAGEKARLSIAQALIKDSPIMIFDEPTSLLDKRMTNIVLDHFKKLGEQGKTIIFTTHKPEDITILKPYQAVDIGLHVQGQKENDIKKFDLTTPRNLENFASFFEKRQVMEKRVKEEQVMETLDHARNLVKMRMNEGTNETTNGIKREDLIAFKKIRGKSQQEAYRETVALFAKIGRSKDPK